MLVNASYHSHADIEVPLGILEAGIYKCTSNLKLLVLNIEVSSSAETTVIVTGKINDLTDL